MASKPNRGITWDPDKSKLAHDPTRTTGPTLIPNALSMDRVFNAYLDTGLGVTWGMEVAPGTKRVLAGPGWALLAWAEKLPPGAHLEMVADALGVDRDEYLHFLHGWDHALSGGKSPLAPSSLDARDYTTHRGGTDAVISRAVRCREAQAHGVTLGEKIKFFVERGDLYGRH